LLKTQFPAGTDCRGARAITLLIALAGSACSNICAHGQGVLDAAQKSIGQNPLFLVASDSNAASAVGDLPDAPAPVMEGSAAPPEESASIGEGGDFSAANIDIGFDPMGVGVTPNASSRVPLDQCPYDTTHAKECRFHWHQLIISSAIFNAFQNGGNLYTSYWYRYETTHGKWFHRWIDSAAGWRWDQWQDGNPFVDDYIGHGMMGSITDYLWIQNDPKGMTLELANTKQYWHSRLRALAFSTAYSFEWKLGPFGEAGIGHNGDHIVCMSGGCLQNNTGVVELVTTPAVGLAWTIAEDYLDKHVVSKAEVEPRNPFTLLALSFLTPSRATANILRWRSPWYRDGRRVQVRTFFAEPPGPEDEVSYSEPGNGSGTAKASAGVMSAAKRAEVLPVWPHYGGVHEFGAWWGLSLMTGHIWGYAKDVKYMPWDLQYSYLLHRGTNWNFRYSPEVTVAAMLDEPKAGAKPPTQYDQHLRSRTYGGGASPVGMRVSFYPESRVQPFLSSNGGFIYFGDRVLSPQGSQFMYTIDYGGGLTFFHKQRQSISIGYRYQHLSNANISFHNPGTDTNVFYVQVSRFRTKGYR
jgi:hypothetical protein